MVPPFENDRLGAAHGFDEPFVFNSLNRMPLAKNDASAHGLSLRMAQSLIDFARTGCCAWPPYDEQDRSVQYWT
ncbi:hypothetical protein VE25_06790 [Devosia geojensis]|uniref:Carboxylesterase type B domain-containing protein n=2 Tax=Devosia geojensis TaxID=443610 RepID=A0A0F5FUX0_9HYPH|nr:hypothetical protein VE25_06790 [Devosia geojensis]